MSLFDLQDVCIAVGSLAMLDLPMVVDLIGIYVLKGPYCLLTKTNWFLQTLSVIPRGSWGDVSRRFTMIRWAMQIDGGRLNPVVDLNGGSTAAYREEPDFPCDFWLEPGASTPARSGIRIRHRMPTVCLSARIAQPDEYWNCCNTNQIVDLCVVGC
ncbi:hypothetical protein F511_30650 [Dorcoceras hygrometricum]|uniref:Uncharacterized protein n=1 Tax=Dorcoceras hygrometricum TaxID=472368 RepID=A0A2Z7AG83_9LAMI|nr:hypothetical protein F511_30650 [Dorcoceras hygrometricum]